MFTCRWGKNRGCGSGGLSKRFFKERSLGVMDIWDGAGVEKEPAREWSKGSKWEFRAEQPAFKLTPYGPLDLVWAVNSKWLAEVFGYPANDSIPDFYGRISDGRWIVFEVKGKDAINKAVNAQLPTGVRTLRALGKPVSLLAISVSKIRPSEGWVQTRGGLLRRADVAQTPAVVEGMTVILDQRWRKR